MKRSLLAFLPLGLWAAAVLAVGAFEFAESPVPSGWDKAAHFVMYGVGGGLAAWAGRIRGGAAGWVGLIFVLLTGAADELHQMTVPSRHGDVMDWVADATGALLAFLFGRRLLRRD